MTLSVVVPVYNEEATIGEVIDLVDAVPIDKEIIVVDDGSTDRTLGILASRSGKLRHVHENRANFGKGAAVRIGLTYASQPFTIIQDADLEADPQDYERILAPLIAGETKVVYGSRFRSDNRIPLKTRLANRFLVWLTNVLYGSSLTDMETAYKAFRTELIQGLRLTSLRFEIEPEITAKLLRSGYRIVEVPISYRPRTKEEGKKMGFRDGLSAIWCLVRCRLADPRSFLLERRLGPSEDGAKGPASEDAP